MMKGKKAHNMNMHIIIGLVVVGILWYLNLTYRWIAVPTDNGSLIQFAIIAVVYALFPDLDQPASIINKYSTIALIGVIIYSFYNPIYQQYGILSAVILGLLRVIEHRTLIHSVLGAAVISAPLLYLSPLHALVGFVAFLSHIISDNDFSFGWEKDTRLWK